MTRRRAFASAALIAGVLATTGCAQYYYGASSDRPAGELLARNHAAADVLREQAALRTDQPVLVATVVQIDRLDTSSRLGRLVSEQVASRLAQRGLRVTELRLRETLAMRPFQGELLLSREAREVSQAQSAQAVLVGTYAVSQQAVYVSLKLVGPQGNTVLAAHDYVLPMDGNLRSLLVQGY